MELGAEINIKVKKTIKKQLQTLGCYVDDELPEYIMVMIANKRTKEQMIDDLNLFLSDEAEKFVSWLFIVLGRIQKAVEVPDIDTLLEKENGEIDNKGKSKKKSKSDDESSRNSKIKERNKRRFKEKKSNLSDEDKEYLERKKRREKEAKEREEKRKKEAEREEEKAREIKRRREERRKRDEEERKKASDQRRGRSHDRQRSRSRSRSRSKKRHRSRSRSRGHRVRSRSHSRGRRRHSRSHSRDRRSHSRSHSRGRRGRSRSRSRVRSRSHSRRRSRSRSRDEKRETRKVSLSHEKRNDSSENRNLEEVKKIQENDKIRAEAEAEAKRIENRNESAKNPMEFVKLIASDINKKLFQHQNDVKPKEVVAEKIEFAVPSLKDVPTTDTNDITNKANISLQAVSQYGEGEIENEKVEKKTSENRKEMKRQHSRSKSRSRSRSRDRRNSRRSRSGSTSKDRNHNRRRRKSHSRERKNATNDKKDRTVARRDRSRSREREPRKRRSRSRDRRNSGKVDHHERSRKDGDTAKANAMDNENDRKEIEGKDLRNVIRGSSQEDGKTKSLSSQVKVHTNFKRPAVSKNREVSSALLKRAVTDVVKEQPKQEQFVEEDEVELDYTENIDEALHQTAKNTDQNDDRRIISFGSPNTDLPTITLVNYNSDNKPSPERVNTSNNKQYNNKKPRHDNRVKTQKDGRAENVYSEEEIELRKGLLQDMSKVDARYAILKSRLENETSQHKREKEKEASKPKYMGSMIADLEENSNRQKRLKLKQQKSRERKREYEERLVAQQVRREEGLLKRRHSAAVEEELKKRNRSDILKKETERIKRQELLRSGEIEDKSDLRNLLRGRKDKESSDDEDTLANKLREKIKEEKHKRLFGKINSDEKRKLKKERDILREKLKRKRYMKKKAEYMLRKAESRRKEKLEVSLKKDKSDEKIDESEQNGASDKDEWVERSNDNGNESEADENEAQQDRETEEDEEKEEENETGSTHEEEENMEQGNSEEENNEENEKEESDNEENVSEGNEEENPNEQENSSASTEEREDHENETVVEEEANADEEVNEAGEGDEKEKSDNEKVESENEDEAQEQDLPPEQEENVTETLTEDHKPNENSENTVKEKHKKSKKKRRHTRHEFIVTLDGLSGGGKSLSIKTGTHSTSRRHTRRHSAEEHYAVRHTESRWTRDKSSSFTQSDEEFEQIMRKKEAEQQEQRQLRKSRRRHSGGHQHRKRSRDLLDNKEDEEELNEVDREILLAENKLKAQQLLRKSLEQVQNVNVSLDLHENSKSKTAFINPHFQAPFLKKPIGLNDQGTVLTQLGGRGDSLTSLSYSTSLVEVGVAQADKVRAQADKVINEKDVSEQQDISTGDNDSKNVQKIENESAPVEVQSVEQRTSVETSETSSPTTTATKALTTSNVVRTLQERCVYWPDCKNPTCNYVHPTASCKSFPNCSYGARCLYIHPPCKYSERCTNADCPFTHKLSKTTPPPFTSTPMCKFLPNCTKKDCTFLHPILKPCRFGSSCKKPDCLFLHENRSLPGSKSDSKHKWVAEKSHISERKFAVHEAIVVENPINVVVTTKE